MVGLIQTKVSSARVFHLSKAPVKRIEQNLSPFVRKDFDFNFNPEFFYGIHRKQITEKHLSNMDYFQKGIYFFLKKDFKKALMFLEPIKHSNNHALFFIAQIYGLTGQSAKAEPLYNTIIRKSNSSYLNALCYSFLGDYHATLGTLVNREQAFKYYSKSIELNPSFDFAYSRLARHIYSTPQNKPGLYYFFVSQKYYKKVDQLELTKFKALFIPYHLSILEHNQNFFKQYNTLNVNNIALYIQNKPLEMKLEIIDALWKANITFVPSENDYVAPEESLEKKEGDCSEHVYFVKEVLDRLAIKHHILRKKGKLTSHVFVMVHDAATGTNYRLSLSHPFSKKDIHSSAYRFYSEVLMLGSGQTKAKPIDSLIP